MKNSDKPDDINRYEVLIVDDIPDNLQLLSNVLYQKDIGISIATSGKQAIDIVNHKIFDLILLDIFMPEMDGYEVCKILKSRDTTKNIPIIFLTARTDSESITKGFEVGGQDYITKPFNPEELLARVKTHLELKDKKDRLETMNVALEEKVKERTAQLEYANIQLENANQSLVEANQKLATLDKAKNDFLLLINHELRTPLHGITGFTRILEESLQATEYEEFIKSVNESVSRLVKLSESALLITSLRAESYQKNMETIVIKDLINNAIKHLSPKLQEKQININTSIPDENSKTTIDKHLIINCLTIVIENAIQHSPPQSTIEIKTKEKDKQITIEVLDNGPGFSPEALSQLFEFFTSESLDAHSDGFGLGLASAKLIMDTLSGSIEVKNRSEGGAFVKLTFSRNNQT